MRFVTTVGIIPGLLAYAFVDDAVTAAILIWVSAAAMLSGAFADQNEIMPRLRSSSWYYQDENGMDTELRPDAVSLFRGAWVVAAVLLGILGYVEVA